MAAQRLRSTAAATAKPIPFAPKHPLLGHIPEVAQWAAKKQLNELGWMRWVKQCNSKIIEFHVPFRKPLVIVMDPEAARQIQLEKNLPKATAFQLSYIGAIVGKLSMVANNGQTWESARTAFNPGFTTAFLRTLLPKFTCLAQHMTNQLEEAACLGQATSVFNVATNLTMDVIATVGFGLDMQFQSKTNKPPVLQAFLDVVDQVAIGQQNPLDHLLRKLNPISNAEMDGVITVYTQEMLDLVEAYFTILSRAMGVPPPRTCPRAPVYARMERLQQWYTRRQTVDKEACMAALAQRSDVMATAMRTTLASAAPMSLASLLDQVKTLFTAGHDTTASIISWSLYFLATHPEAQRKAIEEVDAVLGSSDGSDMDIDTLNRMTFMNNVVKEALRLCPPAATVRYAPPGEVLQGYDVGDKLVFVPHYMLHHDPDVWGLDADEFCPERWEDAEAMDKIHPCSYQPFSKGPRDCIGKNLALLEIRTVMAMVMKRFTFSFREAEPERLHVYFTYKPANGVMLHVHERAPSIATAASPRAAVAPAQPAAAVA